MEATIKIDPLGLEELADRAAERAVDKLLGRINLEGPVNDGEFLTNKAVMEYLDLSRPTLQRMRNDGRLPFSKIGRKVFYRRSDVEEMLEAGIR